MKHFLYFYAQLITIFCESGPVFWFCSFDTSIPEFLYSRYGSLWIKRDIITGRYDTCLDVGYHLGHEEIWRTVSIKNIVMFLSRTIYKRIGIITVWSCYATIEKKISRLTSEYSTDTKAPIGVPERISCERCGEVGSIHNGVLENKRMIEMNMKENNLSIIRTEIVEICWAERISTKIDNEIRLFARRHYSHVFIVCHDPHLKDISRTKLMTKNMSRDCFSDIMQDMLYLLWCTWKFWCDAGFDILKIESHKKRTKNPQVVWPGE